MDIKQAMLKNPDKYDKSMLNHPEKPPALCIVYHPEDAPKGMQMGITDAEALLEKPGWVDSPEKFPGAKPKYRDPAGSVTERIVDAAVKDELAERQRNAPGLYPEAIDPEPIQKATKADLIDFVHFHRLASGVDETMKVGDLRVWATSLVSAHNQIIEERNSQ